jgi:hypothetical protein
MLLKTVSFYSPDDVIKNKSIIGDNQYSAFQLAIWAIAINKISLYQNSE